MEKQIINGCLVGDFSHDQRMVVPEGVVEVGRECEISYSRDGSKNYNSFTSEIEELELPKSLKTFRKIFYSCPLFKSVYYHGSIEE